MIKKARYSLICGKDKQSYWIVSGKVVVMQTTSYHQNTEVIFMKFENVIDKMLTDIVV